MNRVVITGLGIYSCIGKNLEEVRNSLYLGKSGIILDPVRKEFGYRSGLTGFVDRPSLKGQVQNKRHVGWSIIDKIDRCQEKRTRPGRAGGGRGSLPADTGLRSAHRR